jgi:hypothetical protein
MAGSEPGRSLVTGVASELLVAGHDLLGVIDDPLRREDAVERLIAVAETGIAGLSSFSVQRFQSFEATDVAQERAEASEDVLATALGELTIAQTLLGAAVATGQHEDAGAEAPSAGSPSAGSPSAEALRTSLTAAGSVPSVLEADAGEPAPAAGASGTGAPSLPDAVDHLRKQVDETLDTVVAASAESVTQAFTGLLDLAPDVVKQTIGALGERLKLGKIADRLFSTALWALDQGLAALGRLIPSRLLQSTRAEIERVYQRLREGRALDTFVAATLGVPDLREYANQAFGRPGLAADRLTGCKSELIALTARYKRVMGVIEGIATAISLVSAALVIVKFVLPHLALIVAGAQLLVVAAVLMVGIDYVDVRPGPDLVRGVQSALSAAVE